MKRVIKASADSKYIIHPDDWEYEPSLDFLRYYDEDIKMLVEIEKVGKRDVFDEITYEVTIDSMTVMNENAMFALEHYSVEPWELVDWVKWDGEWETDRYGDEAPKVYDIDDENIGDFEVPANYVQECRELSEKEDEYYSYAYDLEENYEGEKDYESLANYLRETTDLNDSDIDWVIYIYDGML